MCQRSRTRILCDFASSALGVMVLYNSTKARRVLLVYKGRVSTHETRLVWKRATPDFTYDSYDRSHELTFGGGSTITASAAKEYRGNAALPNPEEMLVGALSSCHMLTFLALAARDGLVVDSYEDHAVGTMTKNAQGRLAVTKVVLHPKVAFGGDPPSRETLQRMHEHAHHGCFIANSVHTEVTFELDADS